MARYTGPKWRISRRENASVYGDEQWKKRSSFPGVHGQGRSRPSQYAIQFREKQKVKRMYGMLEKQFRKFFKQATKLTGNSGLRFLQLLELRLDNVIYRTNLAATRNQARQIVSHGHVIVNGSKVNIPSYIVQVGDEIVLSKKIRESIMIKYSVQENKTKKLVGWLDKLDDYSYKVTQEPVRNDMDPSINEQFIVELYSK